MEEEKIEQLIAEYLRPLIEADGGTIEVVEVNDAEVVVRLAGSCSGCPGRPYTINQVLRPALRKHLNRPITVVAAEGPGGR